MSKSAEDLQRTGRSRRASRRDNADSTASSSMEPLPRGLGFAALEGHQRVRKQKFERNHRTPRLVRERDSDRCCVTGTLFEGTAATEVAHIVPFSILNQPNSVHQVFRLLFPWLDDDFLRKVDKPRNALVLNHTLHVYFGNFAWYIEYNATTKKYIARGTDGSKLFTKYWSKRQNESGSYDSTLNQPLLLADTCASPSIHFLKLHELMYRICSDLRIQSLPDFKFKAASEEFSDFEDNEFDQVKPSPVGPNEMSLLEKMTTFFESQNELDRNEKHSDGVKEEEEEVGEGKNAASTLLQQISSKTIAEDLELV
jgi:hypothetical protein